MPVLDQAGLDTQNKKACAVAAAVAKGALLSLAKPHTLANTLFGIEDGIVDIIVATN